MSPDHFHTNVIPENPGNAGKKGCGLKCCGVLVAVPIVLVLAVYLVVFHSSLPFKSLASMIESDSGLGSSSVEFKGVGGSLASGITVDEIIVEGESGDSVIESFTIKYNGILDSFRNQRLILEEVSTTRADFVVGNDFFKNMEEEDDEAEDESDTPGSRSTDNSSDDSDENDMKLFELRELNFANTRFRSLDGEIDMEIPLIRLAGLKIEDDKFELAELEVLSEGLKVELLDATPETIEGVLVPFARKIQGTIQPAFHPLVKSDIDFSFEFATMNGKTGNRFIVANGAYQQITFPGGRSIARIKDLTIGDFLGNGDHILPEHLTLTMRKVDEKEQIESGEFSLGMTTFQFSKQQVDPEDPKAAIQSSVEVDGHKIEAAFRPGSDQIWPPFEVELKSTPELEQPELLSLTYFQKAYGELAAEEKARVDKLIGTAEDPSPTPK